MGTTETIFYTVTVYFGAVKIKKTRHTVWAAIHGRYDCDYYGHNDGKTFNIVTF